MKVALASVGTRGDVQPICVLGEALARAGHDVVVCAPPDAESLATSRGLRFVACGVDVTAWLGTMKVEKMSPWAIIGEFNRTVGRDLSAQLPIFAAAAERADVVVTAGLQVLGRSVAELVGGKSLYVYYGPNLVPAPTHPPVFLPWQALPGWLNDFLHARTTTMLNLVMKKPVNAARSSMGLKPYAHVAALLSPDMLMAWDEAIAPVPPVDPPIWRKLRVDARSHTAGALLPAAAPLDDGLRAFLDAGPCAYVGFGSMPDEAPHETAALVADAAERAQARIVWMTQAPAPSPAVYAVKSTSHAALFARVFAIVHHGGAGTTAAAGRAGVPQCVVPHFMDQPFWAKRVEDAGVAAPSIRRARLTTQRLADAIVRCRDDAGLRERARAMGERLRAQDPVAAAVRVVEQLGGVAR